MKPIDPKAVSDRISRALAAAGSTPWLVGYDANGIQELIVASGRPISMRGASEVIQSFDRAVNQHVLTIFAGGGRGIVLARSEDQARARAEQLVAGYRDTTCGGVMAACWVPLELDDEARSLRWLRHRLGIEKDAARPPRGDLPISKASECAYCAHYVGVRERRRDDLRERVCTRCDAMLEAGRRVGKDTGRRSEMSRSIAEIAKSDRIAVVAADGNNLGSLFDSLHSLVELAAISEVVERIFKHAQDRALGCVDRDEYVSLMTGGDDICTFLPPGAVLRYVETLVEVIESSAAEQARGIAPRISADAATRLSKLGVGIGAVVANVYYPAWRLVDYARQLERTAKTRCHDRGGWRSGFDFAVITNEDSMTDEPDRDRSKSDVRPLQPRGSAWQAALRNARALADVPSAQLAVLAAEHTLDHENRRDGCEDLRDDVDDARHAELANLLRYQVARSPKWQAWYTACEKDWRIPGQVIEHRPDRGSLDLARLIAYQEVRP